MQMFRDRAFTFSLFLNSSVQIALNWAEQSRLLGVGVGRWHHNGLSMVSQLKWRGGIYMGWQPGLEFLGEGHLCQ